ncbi:MAG: hypothetical protein K2H46_00460 [Muribaculaceae bacterium]|nr:hypothetical protein [Muribaculaceae bacterium]
MEDTHSSNHKKKEGAKPSFLILRQIVTEVELLEIISIDFHTIAPLPMQEATKQERFQRERNTIVRAERLETIRLVVFEGFRVRRRQSTLRAFDPHLLIRPQHGFIGIRPFVGIGRLATIEAARF